MLAAYLGAAGTFLLDALADPTLLLVQLVGLAGFAVNTVWPTLRTRRSMLMGQAAANLLFAGYNALLGSLTGAAMCALVVVQIATVWSGSRGRLGTAAFLATLPATLAIAAVTWAGPQSAGAVAGFLISSLGRWTVDTMKARWLYIGCVGGWGVHNVLVGSIFGLVCDAMTIASNGLGIWRERRAARVPAPRLVQDNLPPDLARAA